MKRKHYTAPFKAQLVQEMLREEKTIAQIASEYGVHPTQLNQWKTTAVKGLASLFERKDTTGALKAEYEAKLTEAYAEVGKLTTQMAWLKKNLEWNSRPERMGWIEFEDSELTVSKQAELVGVSRASVYYQPRPPSVEEIAIKHRIDEIYTDYPFYGSRRIAVTLQQEGRAIGRQAVQQHMREMGIAGISPGPNLSKRAHEDAIYPYLLRKVTSAYPNHIWGIEIVCTQMTKTNPFA